MRRGLRASGAPRGWARAVDLGILLGAEVIDRLGRTSEGERIQLVVPAWRAILELLVREPSARFEISPRKMEELIAAKYDAEGYEVTLTPSSGDHGRDVIAVSKEGPQVRVFDQVKAYGPGRRVDANDVRALMGVFAYSDATKGVVTTTSDFAPRIHEDPFIKKALDGDIELVNGTALLVALNALRDQ